MEDALSTALGDTDRIVSEPENIRLPISGTEVKLQELKTRQFFKLLKILTRGAGDLLSSLRLNADDDADVFVKQLIAIVVLSVPEAEEETLEFLISMIQPVGIVSGTNLSKETLANNAELRSALFEEFSNPELEDVIFLIENIVRREAKDIQSLGKRLAGMLNLAEKTGQLTTSPKS